MKYILLLLLFTSSVFSSEYLRTIRIATFNTELESQLALDELYTFVNENENLVRLQEEWNFEFKARASGKYYVTLVEPFTRRDVLQETINTLRLNYPDSYVTNLKKSVVQLPPIIPVEKVVEVVVPEVIAEVAQLNVNQDELKQEIVQIEEQSREKQEEIIVASTVEHNQVVESSVWDYAWLIVSFFLFLSIIFLVQNLLKYRKENETYFNSKLIADEKYKQLNLEIKDREKYLSHASHELRAPMTAIMGLTHLVLDSKIGKQEKEYIKQIESSATNLLNIVNDILDVSKIRAGELRIEKAEFNINDILEYVSNIISLQAKKNNVCCVIDVEKGLPSLLIGDSLRLGQVLINLLGNAVKFTQNGDVTLSLKKVSNHGHSVKIEFFITDTGIGMTQEQVATVFQSFSQANESISRKFGGTGLGLSISQELVKMMHGEIKVKSELHKGTTFSFSLSFKLKDHLNKRHYRLPSVEFMNKRALIIDSSESNTLQLIRMLGYFKYKTHTIPSFEEAIIDEDLHFDILIVNKDQLTVSTLEKLGQMREKHDFKLVLLSELFSSLNNDMLDSIVIDGYLKTQFTKQNILNLIINLYTSKNVTKVLPVNKSKNILNDITHAKILVAEDNEVNHKVIKGLLRDTTIDITFVINGKEAIDILLNGEKFDLILMDLSMPIMNGYEATKEIRNHSRFDAIPILAFTADVMEETITKAMSTGMQGHISKPIIIDIFYNKIHDALKMQTKNENNSALHNLELEILESDYSELSTSVGLKCHNNDKSFYNATLKDFKIMYINSALDLEELCRLGKFRDARHKAMDIKDVSLSIGAYNLCESAAMMEYSLEKGQRSGYKELIAFYELELAKLFKDIDLYLKNNHI